VLGVRREPDRQGVSAGVEARVLPDGWGSPKCEETRNLRVPLGRSARRCRPRMRTRGRLQRSAPGCILPRHWGPGPAPGLPRRGGAMRRNPITLGVVACAMTFAIVTALA